MSGSYAHITVANVASEKRKLVAIPGFPRTAIDAANLHANFLELGSISPDYPYLDITSAKSKEWADTMHYTHTCAIIYSGSQFIRSLEAGIKRDKCLAWLMGYTAHVVTDMCVHPIVELKVGPYKGHETPHRRCEMHQDVYIFFNRMGTSLPQTSNHLNATIRTCSAQDGSTRLDEEIGGLWEKILQSVHEPLFRKNWPNINEWHQKCYGILQSFLPTTSRFVGFSRHICDDLGLLYPTLDEVDSEFIEDLLTPDGGHLHYDDIFDRAISYVQKTWLDVTNYALGITDQLAFGNDEWNLDTGRIELVGNNKLVFWEVV